MTTTIDLRCTLLLAALPALLAAMITGFVMGFTVERAGVLALMAGLFACRAGLRGLLGESEFEGLRRKDHRTPAVLVLLLVLFGLPYLVPELQSTWLLWSGAVLLAAGAVGLGLRIGRLQEPRLVQELCQAQERTRDDEALAVRTYGYR